LDKGDQPTEDRLVNEIRNYYGTATHGLTELGKSARHTDHR